MGEAVQKDIFERETDAYHVLLDQLLEQDRLNDPRLVELLKESSPIIYIDLLAHAFPDMADYIKKHVGGWMRTSHPPELPFRAAIVYDSAVQKRKKQAEIVDFFHELLGDKPSVLTVRSDWYIEIQSLGLIHFISRAGEMLPLYSRTVDGTRKIYSDDWKIHSFDMMVARATEWEISGGTQQFRTHVTQLVMTDALLHARMFAAQSRRK